VAERNQQGEPALEDGRRLQAALLRKVVARLLGEGDRPALTSNDVVGRNLQAHEPSLIVDVHDCLEWHAVEPGPHEEQPPPNYDEVGPIGMVTIEQMLDMADVSTVRVIDDIPLGFGKPGR